jgi:tetrahydromethanopterin S-methyltransferase subunit F
MRPNQPMDMVSLLTAQVERRIQLSERDERARQGIIKQRKDGDANVDFLVLLAVIVLLATLWLMAFVNTVQVLPADRVWDVEQGKSK